MLGKFNRSLGVVIAQILKSAALMLAVAAPRELRAECSPPEYIGTAGWLSCHASPVLNRHDPAGIGVEVDLNLVTGQTVACFECCEFA